MVNNNIVNTTQVYKRHQMINVNYQFVFPPKINKF